MNNSKSEELEMSIASGSKHIQDSSYIKLKKSNSNLNLEETASVESNNRVFAILCMVGYCAWYSISLIVVKASYELSSHIKFLDHLLIRGALSSLCFLIYAFVRNVKLLDLPKDIALFLLLRIFASTVGFSFLTSSLNYISVSMATIITNLIPFYIAIMSYFFLNENITKTEVVLMCFGFGGIVLISIEKPTDEK